MDSSGPVEYAISLFEDLDWSGFSFTSEQYSDVLLWWKSNYLASISLSFIANLFNSYEHMIDSKLDLHRYCEIISIILQNSKQIDCNLYCDPKLGVNITKRRLKPLLVLKTILLYQLICAK